MLVLGRASETSFNFMKWNHTENICWTLSCSSAWLFSLSLYILYPLWSCLPQCLISYQDLLFFFDTEIFWIHPHLHIYALLVLAQALIVSCLYSCSSILAHPSLIPIHSSCSHNDCFKEHKYDQAIPLLRKLQCLPIT